MALTVSRLTEDDEDVAGLQAVGSGEEMSVSEKTGATAQIVVAGGVPDDDQGSPGELTGSGLLTSVNSELETGGPLLSLSTLTGAAWAGDQPEEQQETQHVSSPVQSSPVSQIIITCLMTD